MKFARTSLFFIYFLMGSTIILAQSGFFETNDSLVQNYHSSLYQFNFVETQNQLHSLTNKANTIDSYLFQVNYKWWEIITGEQSAENFQACLDLLSQAQKIIDTSNLKTESETVSALLLYLFEARIHVFNDDYYKALVGYSKVLKMIKQLMESQSDEMAEEQKLILGFYNYSLGKIKAKYPVFYPYFLVLPEANFELGKKWVLESIKSNNIVVKTEAIYFLMKISIEVDKDYENAKIFASQLVTLYPDNLLFLFYQYQVFYQLNNYSEAKNVMQKILQVSNNLKYLSAKQKTHFIQIIEKDFPLSNEQ